MKLTLIRHGLTEANERRCYCGSTDLPLSEKGREALLAKPLVIPAADRYVTSGMRRCDETLRLLCGGVPRRICRGFREIDFGAFEMRSYEELKDDPAYLNWISGDNEANVPPGGESGLQMRRRVRRAFQRVCRRDVDTVIVTHGGVIAAIMADLFPGEGRSRYEWQSEPGHGYLLERDPEGRWTYGRLEEKTMSSDWRNKKPEECNYSFNQHRACEFFPCHKTDDPDNFNCLFCYCPLYTLGSKCGGNFVYLENGHKDCSNCLVPHRRSSYSYIISKYPELAELAKKNR